MKVLAERIVEYACLFLDLDYSRNSVVDALLGYLTAAYCINDYLLCLVVFVGLHEHINSRIYAVYDLLLVCGSRGVLN